MENRQERMENRLTTMETRQTTMEGNQKKIKRKLKILENNWKVLNYSKPLFEKISNMKPEINAMRGKLYEKRIAKEVKLKIKKQFPSTKWAMKNFYVLENRIKPDQETINEWNICQKFLGNDGSKLSLLSNTIEYNFLFHKKGKSVKEKETPILNFECTISKLTPFHLEILKKKDTELNQNQKNFLWKIMQLEKQLKNIQNCKVMGIGFVVGKKMKENKIDFLQNFKQFPHAFSSIIKYFTNSQKEKDFLSLFFDLEEFSNYC